jgi:crossover junction endodeoxyribonuclease RusA
MLYVTVFGTAVPQGSKRHVGNGRMIESAKQLRPWRKQVSQTVTASLGDWELTKDPIHVTITFRLQRPASVSNPRRVNFRLWPTVKPDIDKLTRAILDSMTGIVYVDDSQVVKLRAEKQYVEALPSTTIVVENLIDKAWK